MIKKQLLSVAFIALFVSGVSLVQGAALEEVISPVDSSRFITWTYNETPLGLYLPKSTGKPLPVVMYLHYCTGTPVYPEFWIVPALNALEPCAVFLPTAPALDNNCADWGGTYDQNLRGAMVTALHELDSLIKHFGFDAERQYLYGESMGGEGVYRLLTDFPDRFAGAISVVGYTVNKGADKMAKTPLWILHGAEDGLSPVANDRAIYQAILDAGGTEVTYTEYPDLDHVPAMEHARTEPGLLAWLLAQKKNTSSVIRHAATVDTYSNNLRLSCNGGRIYLSSPLPSGATLTLFDLGGKVLFATTTFGTSSVVLPSAAVNRVVVWQIAHPMGSASGKIPLVQR